ncbi:Ubiquitin-binding protein CUE5 [Spathaspora sp. JA1]|nr:Ubiquitin-binding protein CUE5 [Spathaspora sp. JA1]
MSKKNEALKVVSSEPVDSIDESPSTKQSPPLNKESPAPKNDIVAKEKHDSTEEVPINEEAKEEVAPPQPPKPVDPIEQITQDLKDAFPNIEDKIITACLIASQGNPDPAFNALLYISDPTFKPEIPPPQPIATKSSSGGSKTLTDDELLARKLQKEFELEDERRRRHGTHRKQHGESGHPRQKQNRRQSEDYDDSPDEFAQIKETFTQGLEDARTTLNGWVSGLAQKIDNATGNAPPKVPAKENPKLFGALGGSSFENRRRTTKFDEDPEIITNDFHDKIQLTDNDGNNEHAPPKPARPSTEAQVEPQPKGDNVGKKWQPLDSEVPASSDAFLVTDSEEEGEETSERPPVPPLKK